METTAQKTMTKREFAMQYFKNIAGSKFENYKDQIFIFEYENNGGILCAIFEKRGNKPTYHYRFKNEAQRVDFIKRQKESADRDIINEQKRRQQAFNESQKYVPGAILYDSWGYEQTNIDFYIILERVNNTLTLQRIGEFREYSSSMSGTKTPDPSKLIDEPFKKRISKNGYVNIESYSCTKIYNGTPKHWSSWA